MVTALSPLKNHSSNMGDQKIPELVLKSHQIHRSKKNPNSDIQVEKHGK
jgi:hypothetical protein